MRVNQKQQGNETVFDFYHRIDGPHGEILHLVNIASDEGTVNTNAFDPNEKYVSRCAGDRVDYYEVGSATPYGTDRLNDEGDWIGCNYNAEGCVVDVTICLRNPSPNKP
jgi:hypothetical protein